ncbi:MAG: peptide MFS transporter [Steroidobacteraceae bacterium]
MPRTFFGHPAAFSSLFFTELWERFSYYGMRALLVLFLVGAVQSGGMGLDDRSATAIYGLYTAGVYIMSLPGGWYGDRVLGGQRAVLFGAIGIAVGHGVLAVAKDLADFCVGLAIIVLGTGLLKPNIAALVAALYPEGGARRDAGFTFFYLSINIGAFIGPLVTGALALRYGWHVGFAAAALGMGAGAIYFWLTRRRLGTAGRGMIAPAGSRNERNFGTFIAVVLLAVIAGIYAGFVRLDAVGLQQGAIYVLLALSLGYFVYLFAFAGLDRSERRKMWVVLALCAASTVFWSGFEQAGSSLNLFAERYTDRIVGAFTIPTAWFQSLNSTFIILFAPMFSVLWIRLGRYGHDLSPVTKFALGLLGMGGGFLVMAAAARIVAGGELAAPTWLLLTYLLHTWGELALSPVGMSAVSQLVPHRYVGQSMGLWYSTLALGNLLASRIAGEFDDRNVAAMPAQYLRIFWYGAIAAAVLIALLPLLRRASRPR